MALTRFSASLDRQLLARFDRQTHEQGYPTRSKAVADLIRESLVCRQWQGDGEVAGAIVLMFDHHRPGLAKRLTHIQHDHHHLIASSQHLHLDHDNCLEIIVARGRPAEVRALADKLRAVKGVTYTQLAAASTGSDL